MGKRELLIVAVFTVLGAGAYQLTAPAPKAGERRFSWTAITDAWRRQPRSRAQADIRRDGSVRPTAATSEIRIVGTSNVTVVGEDRTDVTWVLLVQAGGPNDAAARAAAEAVTLAADDMGGVLTLAAQAADGPRPVITLTVRLPHRLAVRLDAARRATVSGVASIRLDNALGDVDIRDVAGLVTGSHRNGTLTLTNIGATTLNLSGSNATLAVVRGETAVTARNGSTRVHDAEGTITVDAANSMVEIVRPHAPVRLTTSVGDVTVTEPGAAVRLDARNARLFVALAAAVPVTVMMLEGALRFSFDAALPIDLDVVADHGTIVATDVGVLPQSTARGAELHHTFGTAAHVAIRSDRGEIEIAHRK